MEKTLKDTNKQASDCIGCTIFGKSESQFTRYFGALLFCFLVVLDMFELLPSYMAGFMHVKLSFTHHDNRCRGRYL